jgi:hypothetical protein
MPNSYRLCSVGDLGTDLVEPDRGSLLTVKPSEPFRGGTRDWGISHIVSVRVSTFTLFLHGCSGNTVPVHHVAAAAAVA